MKSIKISNYQLVVAKKPNVSAVPNRSGAAVDIAFTYIFVGIFQRPAVDSPKLGLNDRSVFPASFPILFDMTMLNEKRSFRSNLNLACQPISRNA